MPKGTKVDKLYQKLIKSGKSKASAARIAQSQTGQALATGKAPKKKRKKYRNRALKPRKKRSA